MWLDAVPFHIKHELVENQLIFRYQFLTFILQS